MRLRASDWNALADLHARHVGRHGPAAAFPQAAVVPLHNASGTDVLAGGVLAIEGPMFDPAASEESFLTAALEGVTPGGDTADLAILLEPCRAGSVASACVAGVCPARLSITSIAHGYAAAVGGTAAHLASATSGPAEILWRQSAATGTQWALVRLGNRPPPVVEWGIASADWSPAGGNQVVLTVGAEQVTCSIHQPSAAVPLHARISAGDVLPFVRLDATHGLLLGASPLPGATGADEDKLLAIDAQGGLKVDYWRWRD